MKVTFLGTGTSHGVPMLGCSCPVCKSKDPRDKRYRSSLLLEKEGKVLVIDTGYEFRLSLLREDVKNVDAVLYTHSHADHLAGIDDLRVFSQNKKLCIYSNEDTINYIKTHYSYAVERPAFPGIPHLTPIVLEPYKEYEIESFTVVPLVVEHGRMTHMKIYGYRIGPLAYITDCTYITDESFASLKGISHMIIGALRKEKHGAHFSFEEAHEAALKAGAKKIYFTHINHNTSYIEISSLYADAESAYDGLSFEV